MNKIPQRYRDRLLERQSKNQFRSTQTVIPAGHGKIIYNGQTLHDFSSNDYLGLSHHPAVKQAAAKAISEWGCGATASRLISGSLGIHEELEHALAHFSGTESALIFNSGYQANASIIPALVGKGDVVFTDKLVHNSIIQGCKASNAEWQRYRHNDVDHLSDLLSKLANKKSTKLIVTESVFSMDGDRAPLTEIAKLARRHDALFMVDEAHAIGVLGPQGRGLSHGIEGVTLRLGTFGKSLGSFGAYVALDKDLRSYLVNFCGGFIYTTALPPSVISATLAALEEAVSMDAEREKIYHHSRLLRTAILETGAHCSGSDSHIVPLVTGKEELALSFSDYLRNSGYFVHAIRPPTVPESSSRLRFTVSANHTSETVDALTELIKTWQNP